MTNDLSTETLRIDMGEAKKQSYKEQLYKVDADMIYISPFINPKTGMHNTRRIPITSPLHPSYSCKCGRDDCEDCSHDY